MNTGLQRIWTGRNLPFGMLLIASLLAAGYDVQPTGHAQDSSKGQDAPEQSQMQMMCPMMTALEDVKLSADSPVLLMAQAGKLKLSDEQKKQLKEIAESARQDARNVLTAEQRQTLEESPQGPLSMMQIAMMQMKSKRQADDSKMCPMCRKMMMQKKKMMQKKSEDEKDN